MSVGDSIVGAHLSPVPGAFGRDQQGDVVGVDAVVDCPEQQVHDVEVLVIAGVLARCYQGHVAVDGQGLDPVGVIAVGGL